MRDIDLDEFPSDSADDFDAYTENCEADKDLVDLVEEAELKGFILD